MHSLSALRKFMVIEIVYAKPEQQIIFSIQVPAGSTINDALILAQIEKLHPEINLADPLFKCGIFGKLEELATPVKAGDRIEIYRPLLIDPKEGRRQRAAVKET